MKLHLCHSFFFCLILFYLIIAGQYRYLIKRQKRRRRKSEWKLKKKGMWKCIRIECVSTHIDFNDRIQRYCCCLLFSFFLRFNVFKCECLSDKNVWRDIHTDPFVFMSEHECALPLKTYISVPEVDFLYFIFIYMHRHT